jgi:hypothetical protein
MNNIGQHDVPSEPERKLVECAISEMLQIARSRGITAVDFIQLLDSGMRMSDFLSLIDGHTDDGPIAQQDIIN